MSATLGWGSLPFELGDGGSQGHSVVLGSPGSKKEAGSQRVPSALLAPVLLDLCFVSSCSAADCSLDSRPCGQTSESPDPDSGSVPRPQTKQTEIRGLGFSGVSGKDPDHPLLVPHPETTRVRGGGELGKTRTGRITGILLSALSAHSSPAPPVCP